MMNLEEFLTLLSTNPNNISICYENVNGKENLKVNGEDVLLCVEEFDDSETIQLIEDYKENIELLDDCVFVDVMEEVSNIFSVSELDKLLKKKSFTKREAEEIKGCIHHINMITREKLARKIAQFEELYERF